MNDGRTNGSNCAETVPPDLSGLITRLGGIDVPPPLPRGPLVYFIQREGKVKIGFTHRLSQRMLQLGKGLVLLGTVPGTTTTERIYHQRFAHLRVEGEWFWIAPDLLEAIAEECNPPPPSRPGYQEIAAAFIKQRRAYLSGGSAALIAAETNVGFWLNMLANGETPERLAGLEEALMRLDRVREPVAA